MRRDVARGLQTGVEPSVSLQDTYSLGAPPNGSDSFFQPDGLLELHCAIASSRSTLLLDSWARFPCIFHVCTGDRILQSHPVMLGQSVDGVRFTSSIGTLCPWDATLPPGLYAVSFVCGEETSTLAFELLSNSARGFTAEAQQGGERGECPLGLQARGGG